MVVVVGGNHEGEGGETTPTTVPEFTAVQDACVPNRREGSAVNLQEAQGGGATV